MSGRETSPNEPADPETDATVPTRGNDRGDGDGYSGQEYDGGSGPAVGSSEPPDEGASSR